MQVLRQGFYAVRPSEESSEELLLLEPQVHLPPVAEDQAVLLYAVRRLLLQAVTPHLPRAARVRPHAKVQRLRQDVFAQQQPAKAPPESPVQLSALLMRPELCTTVAGKRFRDKSRDLFPPYQYLGGYISGPVITYFGNK